MENFLDPNDSTKTVEGYAAPKRAYVRVKNLRINMANENIFEAKDESQIILPEDENPLRNEIKTSLLTKLNFSGTAFLIRKSRQKLGFYHS